MSRVALIATLFVLALIGTADSVYLAQSAMTDIPLVCDIDGLDDCNVVAQSPYSKLLGIPLGAYGVVFYVISLIALIVIVYAPRRLWYKALVGVSVLGALMSIVFLAIQLFLIQAICVYCILSAIITFLMAPLSLLLSKQFSPQLPVVVP
jgi:uncharacterized membrane protein